jgi:hypothetical protein
MKPATAPVETNAVQYISRSKPFGLPFHAAYAIVAAIAGAITKKVNKINPSSTQTPTLVCIAV